MKLIDNWKAVLLKSWTVWLSMASALAGFVEMTHADLAALLPVLQPFLTDRQAGTLAAVLAALVPLARVIKQASLAVASVVPAPQEPQA